MNQTQRVYIYGITGLETNVPKDLSGIGDLSVAMIPFPMCGLGLIISDIPPDFGGLEFEDTVKHVRVLEGLMDQNPVIPVRLGTVSKSLTALGRSLQTHRTAIANELQRLKGRSETGIKAYWKKERVKQELAGDPQFTALIVKAQTDRNAAIEVGQWVEKVVEEWRVQARHQIHERLQKVALEALMGEITSVEMIYNGSFLVDSAQEERLRQALEEIAGKLGDRYEFHCTTHLPPYNFANLSIDWSNS